MHWRKPVLILVLLGLCLSLTSSYRLRVESVRSRRSMAGIPSAVTGKRNNCWPEPFVCPDRAAARMPFCIQIANGWRSRNTIDGIYFEQNGTQLLRDRAKPDSLSSDEYAECLPGHLRPPGLQSDRHVRTAGCGARRRREVLRRPNGRSGHAHLVSAKRVRRRRGQPRTQEIYRVVRRPEQSSSRDGPPSTRIAPACQTSAPAGRVRHGSADTPPPATQIATTPTSAGPQRAALPIILYSQIIPL